MYKIKNFYNGRWRFFERPKKLSLTNWMSDSSESDTEVEQHQFKVIILGDGAVGKTSIAMRHTDDSFSNMYKQTIGLDFFLNTITLPGNVKVALQIWDIGGQTIGGKMLKNYIFGAHAVVLVYDITNYDSFQNLEDWYRLVCRAFKDGDMPKVVLMGNKVDLNHMRAITAEKHAAFAEENDMSSSFVSAKTGDSVNSSFYRIAADLAGVVITKLDTEVPASIVKAHIINHKQHDDEVKAPDLRRKAGCIIQ